MKLFNKTRFKSVEAKRLRNYLLYAVGEIILVVFGILIALYINNWNQDKQIARHNHDLQQKILVQLDRDIHDLEQFKQELDTLNQVYLKTLKRKYDQSKVDDGGLLSTILFEVKELALDKHSVNWIDNAELDNSEISEELIELSSLYKAYFKNIDDIESIIYNKLTTNLEIIESTQPWYTELITDFSCKTECVKYLLHDESHKSRIASLRFLYINGYGSIIDGFYYDLKRAKTQLEAKIKNEHN
ncbi:hypothetical protein [Psychroserpens algicola]|uniref:Uncharacterized protein n=1 Tax=Psychroserpens algicola TaxID=1719034 RepID=A0ABT0HBX3_9FLAO|nr:hypothetical protein [Psychroserpens algicola]MCK8481845.1 hypothetical protein [Psychroserpens algicola]